VSREVLVIGAGIGGLCAAIALRRSGREVRVLERAPRLEAVGAGLMVATNAVRVLFELGVGERLAEVSPPARTAVIEASDGRVLRSVPIG
jgi:2-polyprenyl-6-methoxyphenol hydroxylase-like FAD-dependent oxidoreductase